MMIGDDTDDELGDDTDGLGDDTDDELGDDTDDELGDDTDDDAFFNRLYNEYMQCRNEELERQLKDVTPSVHWKANGSIALKKR